MKFFRKRLDAESKVLFKNSTWVFCSNFFSTGLAFLRSVVIARGLGAGIYGIYAIVVAFVALVQEFLNLNIGTALIRYGAVYHAGQRKDKLQALVKVSLWASLGMAIVSVVVIALLINISYETFIEQPGLEWFIVAYALAASLTYINSISRGLLRLYYKFRLSSIIQMAMDVIETIAIVIAVFFYPKDLNVFFVAIIITRFLNGFICNLLAFWELRKQLDFTAAVPDGIIADDIKDFRGFVVGNSIGNTLKTLISQGDVVLLGALSSPQHVAYYAVAKKVAYSILTLTDPLVQSIFPQFSHLLAEMKIKETRNFIIRITALGLVPASLFLAVAMYFNQEIIGLVYGAEYLPAVPAFNYFLVSAVLSALSFWLLPLIQSLGLIARRLQIYMVTIVAGVSLAYVLVPQLQSEGMAIALLLTNVLNLLLFVWLAHRKMVKLESGLLT